MNMKFFSRSTLPWVLAALFALAFAALAFSRRSPKLEANARARQTPSHVLPGASHEKKILYWADPMTPGYKSDKPGKSPFMDMDLVPVYEQGTGAAPAAGVEGYSSISVPQGRQQAIGVQLGRAEIRELTKTIRTVGRVTFDETLHAQIHAKFEGYVERLYVDYTGKPVRKGQPLLSIYSPELLATQQEYLIALRAREQFRTSANADVSRGGVDLYESARERLLLWDISPGQLRELEKSGKPQKALTLYSPVDGYVMTKNAVLGARVMPADTLFEIAGFRRVWVLADVYESEAAFVAVGQKARMSLSYLPGRTWVGKVSFIAPVLDEKTRTVKVRIEFENPDSTLKPEMFADVSLDRPVGRVVAVPDGAVLSTGTRALVFVAKGDGLFEPRAVETGAKVDGFFEIRKGLGAGEEVVTQANFLIDSESRLKSALGSMTGPAGQSHGPAAAPVGKAAAPPQPSGERKPATPNPHVH
jgi:membrane fusion protein, copper/silver efflux system